MTKMSHVNVFNYCTLRPKASIIPQEIMIYAILFNGVDHSNPMIRMMSNGKGRWGVWSTGIR